MVLAPLSLSLSHAAGSSVPPVHDVSSHRLIHGLASVEMMDFAARIKRLVCKHVDTAGADSHRLSCRGGPLLLPNSYQTIRNLRTYILFRGTVSFSRLAHGI